MMNTDIKPVPSSRGAHGPADERARARPSLAAAAASGGNALPDETRPRIKVILKAARYYGVELDPVEFRSSAVIPTAGALSDWAQNGGMWSRAVRIRWSHLMRLQETGPVVLLF